MSVKVVELNRYVVCARVDFSPLGAKGIQKAWATPFGWDSTVKWEADPTKRHVFTDRKAAKRVQKSAIAAFSTARVPGAVAVVRLPPMRPVSPRTSAHVVAWMKEMDQCANAGWQRPIITDSDTTTTLQKMAIHAFERCRIAGRDLSWAKTLAWPDILAGKCPPGDESVATEMYHRKIRELLYPAIGFTFSAKWETRCTWFDKEPAGWEEMW